MTATRSHGLGRTTETQARRFRLKLIGVGGAGGNCIQQIAAAGRLDGVDLLAINTDLQALSGISGAETLQIGATVTRGLGAGGDPDVGTAAAQQDIQLLEAAVRGADMVFVCAGLGGGTGTGASPLVAKLAKEQGAVVLGFVMWPFGFEGTRRRNQAETGLEQLKAHADAVICLENDRLMRAVGENAPVTEAFRRGNELVANGVRGIWQLLARRGLINLDFAALRSTLGGKHGDGSFSHAEASGPDRVREAIKTLLENPFFNGTELLTRAEGVLVSVLGGPDLTLADVQRIVAPVSQLASRAHVIFGAAIDNAYAERLAVTLIAAHSRHAKRAAVAETTRPLPQSKSAQAKVVGGTPQPQPVQETLPLDGITRGKFEGGEPTICNGENLDYPTFLRRGIKLKTVPADAQRQPT